MIGESILKAELNQRQHDRTVEVFRTVLLAISELQVMIAREWRGEQSTRLYAAVSHLRESEANLHVFILQCEKE